MKLQKESDILDAAYRKQIIDEILGLENQYRKNELFKRFECFRDKTSNYVYQELLKQFDKSTVDEMSYALANVSIVKKIINKLSRVYSVDVTRKEDDNIKEIIKETQFNAKMKKLNRYLKLFKNAALYVRPTKCDEEKYEIQFVPLQPYLYDVIESPHDATEAEVVILSTYRKLNQVLPYGIPTSKTVPRTSDNKDQIIADADTGADDNTFIWWTKNYHFTTDCTGEIISGDNIENPIMDLPFVFLNEDTDNEFWSTSGNDLVNNAILINSMITNVNHIGITQGYGQFYMKGKNLPKYIKTGPNKAILMEYAEGEPTPDVGFATASPPLQELMNLIEMQVALLLTTNNLSTTGVSLKLNGSSLPSGVALIIDKAESMEDVQDQQQMFIDAEKEAFEIYTKWLKAYGGKGLLEDWQELAKLPEDYDPETNFGKPTAIVSEKEKLEIYKMRLDLKLDTLEDIIKKDNPSISEDQLREKLMEVSPKDAQAEMDEIKQKDMTNEGDQVNGEQKQVGKQDQLGVGQPQDTKEDPEQT